MELSTYFSGCTLLYHSDVLVIINMWIETDSSSNPHVTNLICTLPFLYKSSLYIKRSWQYDKACRDCYNNVRLPDIKLTPLGIRYHRIQLQELPYLFSSNAMVIETIKQEPNSHTTIA